MLNIFHSVVNILTIIIQILGLIVIITGIFKAAGSFFRNLIARESMEDAMIDSRLQLGYSFSLGLGFLIGASILQSIVSFTWDDIGKLASIILIRTVLNYFLTRDIKEIEPLDLKSVNRFKRKKRSE